MAVDAEKIKLGPCKLTFDVEGTPIVFEQTQGGVTLTYTENYRDINIDQLGDSPADAIRTGAVANVEAPIAEYDLEKLSAIIPGSKLIVDGTDPSKMRVDVSAAKVERMFKYAKSLKIEPLDSSASANDTIVLHKAAPQVNLNYSYTYDNELITNVTFKGFEDGAKGLISFGDPDATAAVGP